MHTQIRRPLAPRHLGDAAHTSRMDASETLVVFSDQIYQDIIRSTRFQRLKKIRFLGAIDYTFSPNGTPLHIRHTRYDHSLGVGLLAKEFSESVELSTNATHTLVSAALLHDIGHAPLSHSLEPVFKQYFGIDHHTATVEVIRDGCNGEASYAKILSAHCVDAEKVIELIGNPTGDLSSLFVGKFNFDTLDAIPRCAAYLLKNPSHAPPFDILRAAYFGGPNRLDLLDAFWSLKGFVYANLIQGPSGLMADLNAQDFMRANIDSFDRDSFFLSETALRRSIPRLFTTLGRPRWDRAALNRRHFEIIECETSPGNRYIERKEPSIVDFMFRPHSLELKHPTELRLIPDGR
jgi:uncharacterized protein